MNDIQEVIESQVGLGRFASFDLEGVSYYPSEPASKRIRLAIYGVDGSKKMEDDENKGLPPVNLARPLADARATGTFTLFIPTEGKPYGVLDMRSVEHKERNDINISTVSTRALAPNRLHNITWRNRCSFYGIDEEGSSWSIHCTLSKK